MTTIRLISAGTYYKWKSPAAGKNAKEMQGLVWWAKNNNPKLRDRFTLKHPSAPVTTIGSAPEAYEYAAAILATLASDSNGVALVPIPSSEVSQADTEARWPALELATRLERLGLGRLHPCLTQRLATDSTRGSRPSVQELVDNYQVRKRPMDARIAFVDDVVTWGRHLAAAHIAMGSPQGAIALTVGATHSLTQDAYDPVLGSIDYAKLADGSWKVEPNFPAP